MANPVQGTQVVGRVASLLRLVGRKPEGSSLAGLVRESGLTRPTVHRLLTSLAAEGLLDHDARSGNWILGPEIFLLGSVAAARFPFEDIARPSLRRLAEETGESAFYLHPPGQGGGLRPARGGQLPGALLRPARRSPLSARGGLSRDGHHGLPAGRGTGALLSDWEQHAGAFADGPPQGRGPRQPRADPAAGYAVNPGLVLEGSWGMGAAVFDQQGRPAGHFR